MVVHQDNRSNRAASLQSINNSGGVRMFLSHMRNEKQQYRRPVNLCHCTTDCNTCPWVDFRDYELCGQVVLQNNHMAGST